MNQASRRALFFGAFLGAQATTGAPTVWAKNAAQRAPLEGRLIELSVGSSQVVRVPNSLDRIIVGDPTVCDVVSLPPGQLLLTAKGPGETQISAWSRSQGLTSFRVSASMPTALIEQALREAFPGEEDIAVHGAGFTLYLTGSVTDAAVIEAAGRMTLQHLGANGRNKDVQLVNLMSVATPQQVQAQLRFVEVSRTNLRQLGFNAWYSKGTQTQGGIFGPGDAREYYDQSQQFLGSQFGGTATQVARVMPILTSPVQGAMNLAFSASAAGPLSATLSLMTGHGLAKTLSEPTLVTASGEQASFIVGGEFPVPVPDALGRITIQWKSYGAQLKLLPTVTGTDTIHLNVDATVSDIDKANGVTLASTVVPAVVTRESNTSVRMHDGQSFAIAGLLSTRVTAQDNRVPLLGDIPLLGALFRNTSYSRNEEELIVLISVKLVRPLESGEMPSPIQDNEFSDPNDLELFLLGTIDRTTTKVAGQSATVAPRKPVAHPQGVPGVVGFSR